MKFSQTHNDWNGALLETVTLETKEDLHIDDALEAFGRFLRAVGYHFDGEIRIVDDNDQQVSLDDLFDEVDDDGQDFVHIDDMTPEFEGPIDRLDKSTEWPFPTSPKP